MRALTSICAVAMLTACATSTTQRPVVESIVFLSQRSGDGDLYALDPAALSVTPLITTAAGEGSPVWDAARQRLIYQSFHADGADLYSDQQRIMRDPNGDTPPSWSPDGESLVFAANRDGNENLFLARVDGSGERRITDGRFTDRFPVFSPDGQRIMFARRDEIGWDLHSYHLASAKTVRHTLDGVYLAHPAWSPDGTVVAFDRRWDDEHTDIALLTISTGEISRLTERHGDAVKPAFSLDGRRLAFAAETDDDWDLWEMQIDGSGLRQLTNSTGFDGAPVYVPERAWLHLVMPAIQSATE